MFKDNFICSKNKKYIISLSSLSALGLILSIILLFEHFKVPDGSAFCNIDDYWSCDRVNKSSFSAIFGIPVALFGVFYYALLLGVFYIISLKKGIKKYLKPSLIKNLTVILFSFGILTSVILAPVEFYLMKDYGILGFIKNIIVALIFIWLFQNRNQIKNFSTDLYTLLQMYVLFGVNFALYLTNMEFFVIKAICVYCMTQQAAVIFIYVLLSFSKQIAIIHNHDESNKS